MELIITDTEPRLVDTTAKLGQKQHAVNYNISKTEDGAQWQHKTATLAVGVWNYDAIVSALVNAEYPTDKMQAVQNNYLADPENATAIAEMNEMQQWRKAAKDIAKQALAFIASE